MGPCMSETFVHHLEPRFIFYVNYKVMFSTLSIALPSYFPAIERNTDSAVKDPDRYLKLGIVRNPYARFVSLYSDKCCWDPEAKLNLLQGILLQPAQGQLLEELRILRGQSFAIARTWEDLTSDAEERELCRENFRLLQTISFEEFTLLGKSILARADADPHFRPQHKRYFSGSQCK